MQDARDCDHYWHSIKENFMYDDLNPQRLHDIKFKDV